MLRADKKNLPCTLLFACSCCAFSALAVLGSPLAGRWAVFTGLLLLAAGLCAGRRLLAPSAPCAMRPLPQLGVGLLVALLLLLYIACARLERAPGSLYESYALLAPLALAALPAPVLLCRALAAPPTVPREEGATAGRGVFLYCLLTAAAALLLCSTCSPLYPGNYWVDPNCFFTVGRGMAAGLVPYRDLLEQKGPLLYAAHALSSLVGGKSFFGVYLLEVLAGGVFLYYCLRLAALLCPRPALLKALLPIFAAIVYTSAAFNCGDSAEELCLALLAPCLFWSVRALKADAPLSRRELFLAGLLSGGVLWIKFSLLGFFLGGAILPLAGCLRRRSARQVGQFFGYVALGVCAATAPFVLYFGLHGAIGDWLEVYLYDNIFIYTQLSAPTLAAKARRLASTYFYGAQFVACYDPLWSVPAFFGLLGLFTGGEERRLKLHVLLTLAGLFLSAFCGRAYPYYALIFALYAVFGLAVAARWLPAAGGKGKRAALAAAALALTLLLTPNLPALGQWSQQSPQSRFAAIVRQKQEPTLLNYGFLDGGFYLACDVQPSCRYFCLLNLPLADVAAGQRACLDAGEVDFVVTRDLALDHPLYTQLDRAEGQGFVYRLYGLRGS